jgi:hypothetical protein
VRHRPQYVALPPILGLSFSKGIACLAQDISRLTEGAGSGIRAPSLVRQLVICVLPPPLQSVTRRVVLTTLRFNCDIRALPLLLQESVRHAALNLLALLGRFSLVSNGGIGRRRIGLFAGQRTIDSNPEFQEPGISEYAVPLDVVIERAAGGGRGYRAISV